MPLDPRHPHELSNRDWTVLLCHPDGSIQPGDGCGLFQHDCRLINEWRLEVDGEAPQWIASGSAEPHLWQASLRQHRPGKDAEGPALPQDAVEVRISRIVGDGMHERMTVINHSLTRASVRLSVRIAGDFADVLEAAQEKRQQKGKVTVQGARGARQVTIEYRAERGGRKTRRGLRIGLGKEQKPQLELIAQRTAVRATVKLSLASKGSWEGELIYRPLAGRKWLTPPDLRHDDERAEWKRVRPRLRSGHAVLETAWELAADDLYALRNRDLERDAGEPGGWVTNAGLPIFTGLFGRDALTTGWQGALVGPQIMRGALGIIAGLQATSDDPWRDMEPGKLIHELRRGPLGELGITAQDGYYGTQTTAAMFPLILSELWHWTGDTDALIRYRPTAERALEWARDYGDLDGDGFLEYQQRSPVGIKNQAWKDSDEAIRYPDGGQVPNPIATVEEQAFHFLAICRMAEICVILEDDDAAERYLKQARTLRQKWQEAYWMPDEGFYAMALDPEKRPVRSIGSNPGHALACGIVPPDFARIMAERMFEPDLFSGWGVRTLSTAHPAYNAWAYHLGTVWPVENATFLLGLKRYGLDDLVDRLASALLDAAAALPGTRLPEAIGGQPRDEIPFPVAYPMANCPQAWSAAGTIQLLQVLLGIYPFAPMRTLALVRPRLPLGIDALTLHNLAVGDARVSLRFRRRDDGSASHEVIHRTGTLIVAEAPPPDASSMAGPGEALAAFALERAPGRLARAGRLALGMID